MQRKTGEIPVSARKKNGLLKRSSVIQAVCRFASFLYDKFLSGAVCAVLTSYDRIQSAFSGSRIVSSASGKMMSRKSLAFKSRYAFSKQLEQSVTISLLEKLKTRFLLMPTNSFGILFFSFGFYVTVVYLLSRFAFHSESADVFSLGVGIIFIVLSLFLISVKKHIAQTISESGILRYVLFDFLGMRSGKIDSAAAETPSSGSSASFIIGMMLGLLTIFVPVRYILILTLALILLSLIISSPESSLILILLLLPFLPTKALIAAVALTFVSYLIKLSAGKRVIHFDMLDWLVLAFGVFTLSGGIFTKDPSSLKRMLVYLCFLCAFFLVKNIVRTSSLAKRCMNTAVFSSAIVSVYGICEYFIGSPSAIWQDKASFSSIKGRVVSFFENPNVLGEYLILMMPLIIALFFTETSRRKRFLLFVAFCADSGCLLLTWSRGAWLGLALSVVLFMVLAGRGAFAAGIFALPPALAGLFWFGGKLLTRITTLSDSSTVYRVNIWRGVLKMLSDVFASGIGTGEGAFAAVYPFYALSGIETAPHSHNLYLQITTELGVFGLVIFLLFIVMLFIYGFSFLIKAGASGNRLASIGLLCGLFAFLAQGMTDYVWYNYRVYLMFWIFAGLTSAFISVSKEELHRSENDYILLFSSQSKA